MSPPQILSAVLARLYGASSITSVTTQISAEFQGADSPQPWALPGYAILVQRVGGPAPDEAGLHHARVQFRIYGPEPGGARQFQAAQCVVHDVYAEDEPTSGADPDTGFRNVVCSFIFAYHGVPL